MPVTAAAMVPLMGALAIAVDFSELNRQKQMVLNALDAANFAAARRLAEGATDDQIRAYAVDFFNANLNGIDSGQRGAQHHAAHQPGSAAASSP
ncbi:pilus assembly protein TadG-related protein [Mesorhizobium atlanticum]